MKREESEVTRALDALAGVLRRAAEGQDSPPDVDFDVSWIDVSTVERRAFEPVLALSVHRTEIIDINNL